MIVSSHCGCACCTSCMARSKYSHPFFSTSLPTKRTPCDASRLSRRREEFAVDADVMDEELLRWETSFERTLANEGGDTNKQRGLFAEAFISVRLRASHRDIGAVQRNHERHPQRARQGKRGTASACKMSVHQVWARTLCLVVKERRDSDSPIEFCPEVG